MKLLTAIYSTLMIVTAFAVKADNVALTSGMKITGAALIKPGVYKLNDKGAGMVQISGSGFIVDFKGAKIRGAGDGKGIGIHISDARGVTIKNADVSGCLWGVTVERSVGVKLLNCTASRNSSLKPGTVIDESGHEPEDQWGGGILLRDSRNCLVQHCTSQYQWDGIDVIRSAGNTIEDGDYSYSGNWGIHLWNSSRNTFRRNRAIWCTTGAGTLYQALTGWQTYDSQAVGIDHNSNENTIEENDLRFGGDAIFIRANEGPIEPGTVVPPRNGSHRNILRNNDCSFSPNNAIEVDLVDDTVIEGNNCSFSHYGMWLGYSRRCIVRNNICINDTAHAVEIENGQDDLFENNVFGFDKPRQDGQLIYLRQNGRDKTPSSGYKIINNLFYGAGVGILLKNTNIMLSKNRIVPLSNPESVILKGDAQSQVQDSGTEVYISEADRHLPYHLPQQTVKSIKPGSLVTLIVFGLTPGDVPIVEVDGIPAWLRKTAPDKLSFWMPADCWDRPAKREVEITVRLHSILSTPLKLPVEWPADKVRIDSVQPSPSKIGDTITVTGANLSGGRFLLNNQPATILTSTSNKATLSLPDGILVPTRYNLLFERGHGEQRVHSWPVTLAVQVPSEQMPHLLSATFEPKRLKVGDLLKVTFTLRNNLPSSAPLLMKPPPPFTYEEKQSGNEMGFAEESGALHLRVTSDNTRPHDPGSWPYMFGFDRARLDPGETITVVGYIKMEHAGEREFRVGLVAGGFRFIDDNAFRTKIMVE